MEYSIEERFNRFEKKILTLETIISNQKEKIDLLRFENRRLKSSLNSSKVFCIKPREFYSDEKYDKEYHTNEANTHDVDENNLEHLDAPKEKDPKENTKTKNSDVEYDTEYLTNEDSNEQDFNFDENNQTSVLESIVDPETNSSKTLANEQDFKEYDTEHITNEANNHDVDENNLEHLKAPKEKHPKKNTNTKNSDEEYNTEYLTNEDSNQQDFDENHQTSILESIVDPETNSSNLLDGPQEKNIKEKKTRSKRYRKMKKKLMK